MKVHGEGLGDDDLKSTTTEHTNESELDSDEDDGERDGASLTHQIMMDVDEAANSDKTKRQKANGSRRGGSLRASKLSLNSDGDDDGGDDEDDEEDENQVHIKRNYSPEAQSLTTLTTTSDKRSYRKSSVRGPKGFKLMAAASSLAGSEVADSLLLGADDPIKGRKQSSVTGASRNHLAGSNGNSKRASVCNEYNQSAQQQQQLDTSATNINMASVNYYPSLSGYARQYHESYSSGASMGQQQQQHHQHNQLGTTHSQQYGRALHHPYSSQPVNSAIETSSSAVVSGNQQRQTGGAMHMTQQQQQHLSRSPTSSNQQGTRTSTSGASPNSVASTLSEW